MIEVGVIPIARVMTREAFVRESGRLMIGIIGVEVVLLVTRPAIRRSAHILSVGMTLRTRDGDVSAGQREVRIVMVEG